MQSTLHENDSEQLMYQVLSILSMPQYANTYRFLLNVEKH